MAVLDKSGALRGNIMAGNVVFQRSVFFLFMLCISVPAALFSQTAGDEVTPQLRPLPLPRVSLESVVPGERVHPLPPPQPLSREAESALADVEQAPRDTVRNEAQIFIEDVEPAQNGEEYTFRSIIQGPFTAKDWAQAREQLASFLSIPRSADTEYKARFYLGQAYYFLNMPKESLFEFLAVQPAYPEPSHEWIESCLILLTL